MSVAVTGFSFFNFGFYPTPSFIASSLSLFLWRNFHFLYGVERINLLGGKGHGQFIISLLKKKTLSSGSRRLCISYIAEAKSRSMTRQFSRRPSKRVIRRLWHLVAKFHTEPFVKQTPKDVIIIFLEFGN